MAPGATLEQGGRTLSISGLPGTGNVTENSPAGTVVYTFGIILTPNLLPNVTVRRRYPLIINSNPLTKAFKINPDPTLLYKVVTSGELTLDYETMPNQFDLQILVYDTAGASDLRILTVQVLDVNEPPVFQGNAATQTVTVYILENTPIGPIYKLNVSDPEKPPREINFLLTSEPLLFNISQTGTIYSKKVFDYEKDPHSYILNIVAKDHLGLNTSRTVIVSIININDEPPTFNMAQRFFRIKEEATPGHIVTNLTATDPDGEGFYNSLRFSITNPGGIPNFSINPDNGSIQVSSMIDRDAAPFKEHPNITLEIRVVDSPSGTRSDTAEIVIFIEDLNDNPPVCDQYNYRVEIPETSHNGSVIDLRNDCKDIDAESPNNLFNFTGLSGVGSNKFRQKSPGSGSIELAGNVDLESEAVDRYILNILVQDIASPFFSSNIYIHVKILPVNEFYPVFSSTSYVFNVKETTPAESEIGFVTATDKDVPSTGISYSILAGGGTRDLAEIFWIDPEKGVVKILARLDYETTPNHHFTVQASDNEFKNANASVTVNVLEENDEPPICSPNSYLLEVPVDLHFGTNIGGFIISCEDRDSSPQSFRYSINSGNVNNHFAFSPSAGSNVSRLILASPFDYESGLDRIWEYRLLVFITDDNLLSGAGRATALIQTGTVTLTIKIIPNPTTVAPTTPGVTFVTNRENVYSASAWYVPFIIALGSLLLLGLLGYLTFLLAKYIRTCCPPKLKADKKPLTLKIKKKKAKKEVVWEMTNINAVFDGEARDPVTGKLYEYNSKSGARRWKDTNAPPMLEAKDPVALEIPEIATSQSGRGNLSKREADTNGRKLGEQNHMTPKPSEKKTETADQNSNLKLQKPKEGPLVKGSSSPVPPRRSPIPSPKIYPKYQNQS
ncbi:cadherin-related family member 3 [Elgaria multicarinata webbii]|uniref:cadherin-related family member 3 n=1 Tax=Elgaria multicarinata webbii TaxID=159646 RepID=UPI002FCD0614